MKYYIKNHIIFSDKTIKIKILNKIDDIEIPQIDKNLDYSIVNKNLINKINKIKENNLKNYSIIEPIKNIQKIKETINNNKKNLKKVTSNNYDFIEKTSSLEIIDTILNSIKNLDINTLKNKIDNYLKHSKNNER